jgi:hypothetical protein
MYHVAHNTHLITMVAVRSRNFGSFLDKISIPDK